MKLLVAIALSFAPRRFWNETELPMDWAHLPAAVITILLAIAVGLGGFATFATRHGAFAHSQEIFLVAMVYLIAWPPGQLAAYLGISGLIRVISAAVGDPHPDFILTFVDRTGIRIHRWLRERGERKHREQLEGPEVSDRLFAGADVDLPEADYVVVASRRKSDWEPGVFVITDGGWYRLGTPVERQTPMGVRTLYPLSELRDEEVLRRGVRYEMPPLSERKKKSPAGTAPSSSASRPQA